MNMFKTKWSNWEDISTGSLGSFKYVLQARRHKNGKIEMRISRCEAYDTVAHPSIEQLKEIQFKNK